jgi:hypothetical protein
MADDRVLDNDGNDTGLSAPDLEAGNIVPRTPALAEAVLEPFVAEVRERDAIWKAPVESAPRLRIQNHRNGTITRVLVRSNGRVLPSSSDAPDDEPQRVKGVTVHFTKAEWALIERAVLAGLGLGKIE